MLEPETCEKCGTLTYHNRQIILEGYKILHVCWKCYHEEYTEKEIGRTRI